MLIFIVGQENSQVLEVQYFVRPFAKEVEFAFVVQPMTHSMHNLTTEMHVNLAFAKHMDKDKTAWKEIDWKKITSDSVKSNWSKENHIKSNTKSEPCEMQWNLGLKDNVQQHELHAMLRLRKFNPGSPMKWTSKDKRDDWEVFVQLSKGFEYRLFVC